MSTAESSSVFTKVIGTTLGRPSLEAVATGMTFVSASTRITSSSSRPTTSSFGLVHVGTAFYLSICP